VAAFLNKLLGLDAGCVIRFGQPLDCVGNRVDDDGVSRDARGHVVDARSYLTGADGTIAHDPARDAQYTRELGEAIVDAFRCETVAMATHLVASCAFEKLRQSAGARADIFAMLRTEDDLLVPRAELAERVERLRDRARDLEARGGIVLGPRLGRASGRDILDEALRAFSGYHTTPVLEPRGDSLLLVDTRLIFYYQNRLAAHGLAADLVGPRLAPGLRSPRDGTGKPARIALGSRAPNS
jgi:glycerol-3-phosphate O-acyltransferase